MSYPRDLDEIDEAALVNEISRREVARDKGLCDYCGRKPRTKPCKFPERHKAAAQAVEGDA